MQLSRLESEAYDALKANKLDIFTLRDISMLLGISKEKTYNLLKALKRKGVVSVPKSGLYAMMGVSEYALGGRLNWPAYLSFWSALNYYGLTDNNPRKIFFASARYRRGVGKFKYAMFSGKRFFGYTSVGGIIIAEREKAIIDSLIFPKYAGGIAEVSKCLEASWRSLDMKKLIDYALRVESKMALRRLGFLLERAGAKGDLLTRLRAHIGSGYGLLDPSAGRQNNFDKRWLLDVNVKLDSKK